MDNNKVFTSIFLKEAKKGIEYAIKGTWTYKYKNGYYEVQVPKNKFLPKGFYWYGQAINSSEAKANAYLSINRILNGSN
jgi:hypothetical protein